MAKQTLSELIEDSYYTIKETLNVYADIERTAQEDLIISRLERATNMLKEAMDMVDDDKRDVRIPKKEIEIAD